MASRDKGKPVTQQVDRELDINQLIKHLDILDQRLDNVDSIITSLVQRVMEKPLTMEIVCPKCGQSIQLNVTSSIRLRGKD